MKKELFYIRGNAERADEVKEALLEKYPDTIDRETINFGDDRYIFFVHGMTFDLTRIDGLLYCFIIEYGTELHLPETKEPKFNIGDVVRITNTFMDEPLMAITAINGSAINATEFFRTVTDHSLANVESVTNNEIAKWNKETLHPNHLHYSLTDRKLKHWFLPFDKVLVHDRDNLRWHCDLFSHYDCSEEYSFRCVSSNWKQCIPYNEKTAHLIGTTDDYEEE